MAEEPDPAAVAHAIRGYRELLVDFVAGQMTGDAFERAYLSVYLANDERYGTEVFDLVDVFFADVDAYVSDASGLKRTAEDLDEAELRERARALLRASGVRVQRSDLAL